MKLAYFCLFLSCLLTGQAGASVYSGVPSSFSYAGGRAVPIDMSEVHIEYVFDASTKRATGVATIDFNANEAGFPFFDLVPDATSISLNGSSVALSKFQTTYAPGRATKFRVLQSSVAKGSQNTLEIAFNLSSDEVGFSGSAVRAGWFMNDLANGGREFFEQFGPANFEFDQVQYTFDLTLRGTNREHTIYTNGDAVSTGPNEWRIKFPEYFTTSSLYFHLTESNRYKEKKFTFQGVDKNIPVTVYSSSSSNVSKGVSSTQRILKELERDYGAFYHDKLVIYVTSGGGGMEYCGATITSLWALGHELHHSWFARGVMPANGNAGWIDEAIASWRDNNYPRASSSPNRRGVNLGGFSEYKRETTSKAYTEGATLISEFDFLFRNIGGMKKILRDFFAKFAGKTIVVDQFQNYLEAKSGTDLDSIFQRYVFGQKEVERFPNIIIEGQQIEEPQYISKHPRPFTKAERRALR